jgi:DNA-binding HxlR family transcriptional regulator
MASAEPKKPSSKSSQARVSRARTATPLPGRAVRGSRTGRPLMAALDLMGRRWALRVLWELRNGPLRFRALHEVSGGLSPTLLNDRLAELRAAALVANGSTGYALTQAGEELAEALIPLQGWAERWRQNLEGR